MLHSLTSLFAGHDSEPTARQSKEREWERLLANATSQNERDEINDLFTGQIAV